MFSHAHRQTSPRIADSRWLVAAVIVEAVWAPIAAAQIFPPDPSPEWQPETAPTSAVALGDVDGDSDLDLVGGSFGDPSLLYLHDGSTFSDTEEWFSRARATWAVALGDVDRDGDLDLVCGNASTGNTLYYNLGGRFSETESWEDVSGAGVTRAVALGDVDGDGYLDVVCGNIGPNTLYLGTGSPDSPFSLGAWSDSLARTTQAVALGDVDGDGDLDLVCGNLLNNTLYRNDDGMLSRTPVWSDSLASNTQDVALGDVDGDGDLDLVCGNAGNNTLYLNEGGTFSHLPAWSDSLASITRGVALGDVDGDGDLDFVCGNENQANTIYLYPFAGSPDWTSNQTNATTDVALGDVDGDGDLDLVCGNNAQRSTLYLNPLRAHGSGVLSLAPVWSDSLSDDTRAAALGDVNGDGTLDLVCANWDQPSRLYLNDGARFAPDLGWSPPPSRTYALALEDVDRDGDLDLVCGNAGANTVYPGDRGAFSSTFAWTSSLRISTQAVALGDVDGDGRPDLVCGNDGPNTVYLNRVSEPVEPQDPEALARFDPGRRPFRRTPDWSSSRDQNTRAVALGDVDGDGDLDLVCGNGRGPESNALYRNDDGEFTREPVWSDSLPSSTSSVALGDVDGDGDLDLVCGNDGDANSLYLNDGGVFSRTPDWFSFPRFGTKAVALGDVDGDGDLDLVCGNVGDPNTGGPNTLYLNDGATFSRRPTWSASTTSATTTLALGDVDGDGDLDVVFGNGAPDPKLPGELNQVHAGLRCPVYKGDPAAPRNHQPNNGAFLRDARHEQIDENENLHRLRFRVLDVESDPVCVLPEFQWEGAPIWFPMEVTPGSALRSSPLGVEHFIDWDVSLLPRDDRPVVARLRVISNPSRTGLSRYVSSYTLPLGRITPDRPEIVSSASTVAFPTVTVGGTAVTSFTLRNVGTQDLIVTDIAPDAAIPELRLVKPALPATIAPGGVETVELELAPREPLDVAGRSVVVASIDPLRDRLFLELITDVRALEISSRLPLTPAGKPLPLQVAVPVIVTPAEDVNFEMGYVFHRPVGEGTFEAVPLTPSGERDWIAQIPGEAVTEVGLEYYVRVTNGGVSAFDPPGAPESPYARDVVPPNSIFTDPQPSSGEDFLEGSEIEVRVTLPGGATFDSGMLYFRRGGEAAYDSTDLAGGANVSASIPPDVVGARGVEYRARVMTATSTLYDPPDSSESPHTIAVTVTRLQEPLPQTGGAYRIVSLPLDFFSFSEPITALLSDQPEFGPYDPKRWQVWRYVTEEERYAGVGDPQATEHLRPAPGRAFWLISKDTHQVDTAPLTGRSTPTDRPYEITLAAGRWTMFGNPFAFPVPWNSVRVGDIPVSEAALSGPHRWISRLEDYDLEPATRLEPFDGYWIYNYGDETVLRIPPVTIESAAAQTPPIAAAPAGGNGRSADAGWRVPVTGLSASGASAEVLLGARNEARDGYDRLDRLAPPGAPGPWIRLGADHHEWRERPGLYRQDFRAPNPDGHRFDLVLRSAGVEEIRLETSSGPPSDVSLRLVDLEQGVSVDPAAGGYRLLSFGPGRPYRIAVLAGTEAFVTGETEKLVSRPAALVLDQNAPNPFGSATRVRFGLPRGGPVRLEIFDVRGARVASLLNGPQPAGYHTVLWDGRDDRGRRAATGVYFYRVSTPEGVLARKMARLR